MGVNQGVALGAGRGHECVAPGRDVRRQQPQLWPQLGVGEQAGGDDEEVKEPLVALGRPHAHALGTRLVRLDLEALPGGAQVQLEVGVRARPVRGVRARGARRT